MKSHINQKDIFPVEIPQILFYRNSEDKVKCMVKDLKKIQKEEKSDLIEWNQVPRMLLHQQAQTYSWKLKIYEIHLLWIT